MKKIFYISGAGHSGSTILDIILGTSNDNFSSGELYYFPDKGIIGNQYCSCKSRVPDCKLWKQIYNEWIEHMEISVEEYIYLQRRYTSTKKTMVLYKNLLFPSAKFKQYIQYTKNLFDIIFKVTEKNNIIDSSKIPNRILILNKLGYDIKVIHLKRNFSSVLNSYKGSAKKNIKEGIEEDTFPKSTISTFLMWSTFNILIVLYGLRLDCIKVSYEGLVYNLKLSINKLIPTTDESFNEKISNRGPFNADHLVAGNKIRMLSELNVDDKPRGVKLIKLSSSQIYFSRIIDFLFKKC